MSTKERKEEYKTQYLFKDDIAELKRRLKHKRKHPLMRLVVASRRRGNDRGIGADRSVILGTWDGKVWWQGYKFWGKNHSERAHEFIKLFNLHDPQTT